MIKVDEKDPIVLALKEAEQLFRSLANDRARKNDRLMLSTQKYMGHGKSSERSRLESEANNLLYGKKGEPVIDPEDIEQQQHEIDVLDVALEQQRVVVEQIRGQFSIKLSAANRRRYVEIETRIARAVQELAQANESEVLFFRELEVAGCSSITFRPMRLNAVGIASDSQSLAACHRREVETYLPEAIV